MPTHNLLKTMNNIWHQQSREKTAYLYTTISNDYVQAFKQITSYYHFKKGGPSG
jgi:hypothetical protein